MKSIKDTELERDFIQTILTIGEDSPGRLNAEISSQTITKDCFTEKYYWEIFKTAKEICRGGVPLEVSTVAAGVGQEGRGAVYSVWPAVPRFGGTRTLGQKLNEYRSRRAASEVGNRIIQAAEHPGQEFGESLIKAAAALQASFAPDGTGIERGEDVLLRFYDELERAQGIGNYSVIPTGISQLDEAIGGVPRKFLSIIGAYPGCFKSGIMATIAANVAAGGTKVGFFSLEDNPAWVAKRYVSRATGIPVQDLGRRRLSAHELELIASSQDRVVSILRNISFDGRSGLSGIDVASSARFMVSVNECKLIIIDHIGEIQSRDKRKDRYDIEVAENVRAVRDVAKDTGCAILMASHLRRRTDGDEDISRIPRMTDFSDSSSIEKMCRLALGLWQPPDEDDQVCLKVLKQNEGGARGLTFMLNKDAKSALVKNS